MRPIFFACKETLSRTPEEIASQILDLPKWKEFRGYGPIPGIKVADFVTRTPDIVGTQIHVTNLDGSSHVEEIVVWQPACRLQMRMQSFSAPLSYLATSFVETWDLQRHESVTLVTRSFALNATSWVTTPVLWFISFYLKRAISRNLSEIESSE